RRPRPGHQRSQPPRPARAGRGRPRRLPGAARAPAGRVSVRARWAAPAAALLLAAAAGCGPAEPSSPTPEDLRAIDLSPDHRIVVDDDGFEPAELEITAGEVVLLLNEGTDLHSFTADERF